VRFGFSSMARRILRHAGSLPSTFLMTAFTNLHHLRFERAVARRGFERLRQRGAWPGPAPAAPAERATARILQPDSLVQLAPLPGRESLP